MIMIMIIFIVIIVIINLQIIKKKNSLNKAHHYQD